MIPGKIAVIEGNITQQSVEAIVNAANTSLIEQVMFVCFSRQTYDNYVATVQEIVVEKG